MVAKVIEQLSRFFLVIGVSLVVMSLLFPGGVTMSELVEPGAFEGEYFLVTDDFYLHAHTDFGNYSFSFYLLDYEDVIQSLESGTVNGTNPLVAIENVEQYEGLVHCPRAGTYGILVTHPYNETLIIRFYTLTYPRFSLISLGLAIVAPMAVIQVGKLLLDRGYVGRERHR